MACPLLGGLSSFRACYQRFHSNSHLLSDCSDGDVRLVGGDIPEEGRVEFCHNDDWGTVCDDSWDDGDASVVCRQLGLSSPERALAFSRARFGEGFGPIFLYEVRCAGTESRLADCPSDGINHLDCSHSEDAGVSCTPANSGTLQIILMEVFLFQR